MSTITVKDGTTIYYKDWGTGPVVTFSHGWPLSSDAWDGQMLFLAQNGFRVVALDRRGHGRSSQASSGNDMDGYAADLAAVGDVDRGAEHEQGTAGDRESVIASPRLWMHVAMDAASRRRGFGLLLAKLTTGKHRFDPSG